MFASNLIHSQVNSQFYLRSNENFILLDICLEHGLVVAYAEWFRSLLKNNALIRPEDPTEGDTDPYGYSKGTAGYKSATAWR